MLRECVDYMAGCVDPYPKLVGDVYVHTARVFGRSASTVEAAIRAAISSSARAGQTNAEVIRDFIAELRAVDTSYYDERDYSCTEGESL